ncbi:DUF4265 domain-containing protein [Roseateles sp. BYS96W]|uniref:DUF4265 domain-containing protein n=1 Tax=Pelomonas nitida TaxID=3299027 RepID=A0ABW7GB80_9BURK
MEATTRGEEVDMIAEAKQTMVSFLSNEAGQAVVENMHAVPVGEDLYCLDNSPFYVYGVSFGDVVHAPMSDGRPVFVGVMEHRGHSTYRVRLPAGSGHDDFAQHWSPLEQLGCSFEGSGVSTRRLYAIDVPPTSDVVAVYKVLEDGESAGWWEFEEAHYCARP